MEKEITKEQALEYEVGASWLAPWIFFEWGQELLSRYYCWKTLRKWTAYQKYYKKITK